MHDVEIVEQLLAVMSRDVLVKETSSLIEVRQLDRRQVEHRLTRFLELLQGACDVQVGRRERIPGPGRILFRLPQGAFATAYLASGYMEYCSVQPASSHAFRNTEDELALKRQLSFVAERLALDNWLGAEERITLERIWQVKARAVSRTGSASPTSLLRVVGAYRLWAAEVPVWGPASVALKLGASGYIDGLRINIRTTGQRQVESARSVPPRDAAILIVEQLRGLVGSRRGFLGFQVKPKSFVYGYLALPKRKRQTVLAPHYIATIDVSDGTFRQGYVLITPGCDWGSAELPLAAAPLAVALEERQVPPEGERECAP